MAGDEENWLPRMTLAFLALDSSTHAIDTAAFADAMEKVGGLLGVASYDRRCIR